MDKNKKTAVIYVHGKGGNPAEAEHYKKHFLDSEVIGFEYLSQTPWEAMDEFSGFFEKICAKFSSVILIANSIGAYFSMNAIGETQVYRAYFISPIVNMEKLIVDMMRWAGVTEEDLKERGTIETSFGETLSWEYLSWVRNNPIFWNVPTYILYGGNDNLQSLETIESFAKSVDADLTVMEDGEHWFHTEEQMNFLDNWISSLNSSKI